MGWHLSPGLVQARPARGQRQGARWPVRPPTYAGCATDRAVRIGAGPGPARGREVHGTVRIGLQRAEPDAAAGEPADQHLLGFSPRLGIPLPGALRDPRQLQLQANRAPSGIRCVLATPATTQAPWLRLCLPGLWPPRIAWRTAELRARHGADSHCAPVTDRLGTTPVPHSSMASNQHGGQRMRLIDYLDKGASLGSESPCLTMAGRTLNYRDVQEVSWRGGPAGGPTGGRAGGGGGTPAPHHPPAVACAFALSCAGGG